MKTSPPVFQEGGWHLFGKGASHFFRDGVRRQGQVRALAADAAQHGVHQAGRASFAGLSHEIDGVVDGGGRRHAIQMYQLKGGHPQDVEDLGVELRGGPSGKGGNDSIGGPLPAERPGGDFAGQRAIAFIGQADAHAGKRGRQVRASSIDRAQHLVGRKTRGRNHPLPNVMPGESFRPLRNSRTCITRRPSGWISRMRRIAPSAAATASPSPRASTTVPGAASVRASSTLVRWINTRTPSSVADAIGHGCNPRTRL
jgi:hypothetical protein